MLLDSGPGPIHLGLGLDPFGTILGDSLGPGPGPGPIHLDPVPGHLGPFEPEPTGPINLQAIVSVNVSLSLSCYGFWCRSVVFYNRCLQICKIAACKHDGKW